MKYYNLVYVISIIATSTAAVSEFERCMTPQPENMHGWCIPAPECNIISQILGSSALHKFPQYAEFISKLKCGSEDSNFYCCNLFNIDVGSLYKALMRAPKVITSTPKVTTTTEEVPTTTEEVTTTTEQVTTTTEQVTTTTEKQKVIEIITRGDGLNRGNISDHPNVKLLPDICGFGNNDERVSYGSNAPMFQFLFIAALQFLHGDELKFGCGGTLINERYVLTAAHCTNTYGWILQSVRLGEYDLNSEKDCDEDDMCYDPVQDIPIEKIIRHSEFTQRKKIHDIALLRLSRAADTKVNNVRFMCLPIADTVRKMSILESLVIGWGATENERQADILQMARIELNKEREKCENIYLEHFNLNVTEKLICATGEKNMDTCKGDSGGPLFLPLQFGELIMPRHVQIGIVSIGPNIACGAANLVGGSLYTHVPSYMQWILDNMEP